ncbi:DTW domain-containing protein 2 [Branchiostoma belcheri]|nr:DTW domain-containing protein 2 [Branchiostoma belcheri]
MSGKTSGDKSSRRDDFLQVWGIVPDRVQVESPKAFWNYIKSIRQDSTGTAAIRHQGVLTADPKEKAEALGEQFESVFTKEDTNIIPTLGEPSVPTIPELKVSAEGVAKLLTNLNPNKATGPDGLPPRLLKTVATQISPILTIIFTQSLTTGDVPPDWSSANITPIYKKAHGLDQNLQIDAVVLDFSKAFDTVPHQRLLSKLQYYGIKGHILSWLKAFLTERTQTVVLDGESSKPSRVTSGVPQGTVLGPLLFLLYINDLPDIVNSNVRLFADDCLLYRVIKSPTDAQGLQADLDALTEWQDPLVRPQLEYCASVWDPYTAGGVQAVERVQRRAARMVMNDYGRTSSVTEMLQKLQWPTLANRRREARTTISGECVVLYDTSPTAYKYIGGMSGISVEYSNRVYRGNVVVM